MTTNYTQTSSFTTVYIFLRNRRTFINRCKPCKTQSSAFRVSVCEIMFIIHILLNLLGLQILCTWSWKICRGYVSPVKNFGQYKASMPKKTLSHTTDGKILPKQEFTSSSLPKMKTSALNSRSLSLTLSASRAAGSGAGGCREWKPNRSIFKDCSVLGYF